MITGNGGRWRRAKCEACGLAAASRQRGNNTRVYVDANHDGNFNLSHDLVA